MPIPPSILIRHKKIADHYQVDYVLTYAQVITPIQNGEPVLKIDMEMPIRIRGHFFDGKTVCVLEKKTEK